jgi:Ca2+-transporting ATPase
MDTFAAMALSSLPADPMVMHNPPRNPKSHILDRKMVVQILGVGSIIFIYLLGLWQLLWHTNIASVKDLYSTENIQIFFTQFFNRSHLKPHIGGYELGIFFSTFVMLQLWNIFNVKYYRTNRSLLLDMIDLVRNPKKVFASFSKGFVLISSLIVVGQILIVQLAGPLFSVAALTFFDWIWIICTTSVVLVIPEIFRNIKILKHK